MPESEIVDELTKAATEHDGDLAELLTAAADRIDEQATELSTLRRELEETNEGMVALTLELQEAEQRYRSLFENAVEGIYKTTPDGGQYVMANRSIASILGYDDPETLTREIESIRADVFVNETRYEEYIAQLCEHDRIEDFEYRIRRRDGEVRWVSDNARRMYEDGSPSGFRGGVIDITERKEYEDRLERRTEELEALNRVLRHDIANDMQVIRGFGEHLAAKVDPSQKPQAEKVVTTADHVLQLTEQARTFVETVTSENDPELEPTPLAEMLTYVVERQRDAHPDAEFRLETEVPDVDILANEMLSSVFRNILNNAVTHNRSTDPVVDIDVARSDGLVEIQFVDNGPGIADDEKERIFGKGSQSVDSEGTGIGLYLVHELVTNYGGDVWAEDRVDDLQGSVFVVQLPIAQS